MARAVWRGAVVETPEPPPLTPEARADLEAARWYNASLDVALAELSRAEGRQEKALRILDQARFYVGHEDELIELLKNTLRNPA